MLSDLSRAARLRSTNSSDPASSFDIFIFVMPVKCWNKTEINSNQRVNYLQWIKSKELQENNELTVSLQSVQSCTSIKCRNHAASRLYHWTEPCWNLPSVLLPRHNGSPAISGSQRQQTNVKIMLVSSSNQRQSPNVATVHQKQKIVDMQIHQAPSMRRSNENKQNQLAQLSGSHDKRRSAVAEMGNHLATVHQRYRQDRQDNGPVIAQ